MKPIGDGPYRSTTEEEPGGGAMKGGLMSFLGCLGVVCVLGGVGVAGVRAYKEAALASAEVGLEHVLVSNHFEELAQEVAFAHRPALRPEFPIPEGVLDMRTGDEWTRLSHEGTVMADGARGVVVLWGEDGAHGLDEAHMSLAARRRAESGEEVQWIAFVRRVLHEDEFAYGSRPVDAERVDIRVVSYDGGDSVGRATVFALPPIQTSVAGDAYTLDPNIVSDVIEDLLAND